MKPAIILVDDEAFVLAILKRILTELAPGYELLSIADGATALALLAQRPVALVVTDQRMPDMDGVALTVAIKPVAPQCPVILLTGYPTPEIYQRAQAAGVDYFLAKPFPFEQLVSIVRAALGR
jgi:DNA-binding NtrC family response regulator